MDALQLSPARRLHHPAHALAEALVFPLHGPQQLQPLGPQRLLAGGLLRLGLQLLRLFLPGLSAQLKAPEHILRRGLFFFVFFLLPPEGPGLLPLCVQTGFQLGQLLFHGFAPGADLLSAGGQCAGLCPALGGLLPGHADAGIQRVQPQGKLPGVFRGLLHLLQQGGKLTLQGADLLRQLRQAALLPGLLGLQILPLRPLLLQGPLPGADIFLRIADLGLIHGDLRPHIALPVFRLTLLLPQTLPLQILFVEGFGQGGRAVLQLLRLPLAGGEHPLGVFIIRPGLLQAVLQPVQTVQPDIDLQRPQLVPVDQEGLCPLRLILQGGHLLLQLGDDIPDAHQIFLAGGQLALALLLAEAELGDARGLLKDLPPVGALDGEDLVDAALTDDGIAVPAETGVHKQLVDILQADGLSVDIKLALAAAVIPAGHHDLRIVHRQAAVGIVQRQRHLTEALGLAPGGAAEDHILHLAAPEGLCALLPQDPADGVYDIAFSAAVGADDGRDAPAEVHKGLVGEGFEALDLDGFQKHKRFSLFKQ